MEGKERYEIHIYDDICVDLYDNGVLDKSINDTYKLEELLNQQDKRIKELEETLEKARQREVIIHQNYRQGYAKDYEEMNNLREEIEAWREENQQLRQQLAEMQNEKNELISKYRYWRGECCELKQQLHDLPKKIVSEIKDCLLDFSNGWWRYFMTDGCEYMLSSDLQGCLDETIDTILKKYGGEDEQNS